MNPGRPHAPPRPDPRPYAPSWVDVPVREIKEYEWQYDEQGNPLLPVEWPQPEYNPDETTPRKRTTKTKSMKEAIIILLTIILVMACQRKPKEQSHVQVTQKTESAIQKPYSNACIIFGSSFGEFFQSLYRNNEFEKMISFTSTETIKHFSKEQMRNYYQRKFKFDYALGGLSNMTMDGDTILLTYSNAHINATRRKIVVRCMVENDTTKLVLTKLERTPFD